MRVQIHCLVNISMQSKLANSQTIYLNKSSKRRLYTFTSLIPFDLTPSTFFRRKTSRRKAWWEVAMVAHGLYNTRGVAYALPAFESPIYSLFEEQGSSIRANIFRPKTSLIFLDLYLDSGINLNNLLDATFIKPYNTFIQ